MNNIYVSSTLSVSRKENLDCKEVAKLMSKAGIITSITSNISTQPELEYGCRLTQSIYCTEDISKIWSLLQKNYNFKCGHLTIANSFEGCVQNYLNQKKCS